VPLSASDSVGPALHHTQLQLFRPFRLGQWTRLALVGLFAGELSSGKGCNFPGPSHTGSGHHPWGTGIPHNWAVLGPIILLLTFIVPVIVLLFMYLNSRMRFVLFDSIVAKRCEVGRYWQQRSGPAFQYFVWQLIVALIVFAGIGLLLGVPVLGALLLGWIKAPHDHIAAIVLTGLVVFFAFAVWLLVAIVVHVFTKDFVVPQMALENISAFEGWRRLWGLLRTEKGSYARYAVLKVVMTIAAGIAVSILAAIVIVLLLIPFGGLGVLTVIFGKAAGLTWDVFTITAAVVAGSIFLLVLFYVVSLISVPVIVFFPAYSIYFFASRYPQLATLLYPAPPPSPIPPTSLGI
jgi:hypothetical protein